MTTRIRLQRHGAKKRPFYRVVVADQRAPRDGRFIELLGTYDPLQNPPAIRLNKDRVDYWMGVGAQPTETAAWLVKCLNEGNAINLAEQNADSAALGKRRESKRERIAARRQKVAAEGAKVVEQAAAAAAAPAAEEAATEEA